MSGPAQQTSWEEHTRAILQGGLRSLPLSDDQRASVLDALREAWSEIAGATSGVFSITVGRDGPKAPLEATETADLERLAAEAWDGLTETERTDLRVAAKMLVFEEDAEERKVLARHLARQMSERLLEHRPLRKKLGSEGATGRLGVGDIVGGKFRIQSRLGKGGYGTVFRAFDQLLERPVALKVLNPEIAGNDDARRRFFREVQVSTAFVHRYAVQIREFGSDDLNECLYFTMDLVQGPTLREVLSEGPMAPLRAVRLVVQVLEVLEAAHRKGIVHRDLKPENLLLTDEDGAEEVRVLDFGIAKALKALSNETHSQISQTGEVRGTPSYMSPEQVRAGQVDTRTDIYAVGVVLYEMLAGQLPLAPSDDGGIFSLLHRIVEEDPAPLHESAEQVSPLLGEAVHRALHKSPDERYPDAATFRKALVDAIGGQDTVDAYRPPKLRQSDQHAVFPDPMATLAPPGSEDTPDTSLRQRAAAETVPLAEPDSKTVQATPAVPAAPAPTPQESAGRDAFDVPTPPHLEAELDTAPPHARKLFGLVVGLALLAAGTWGTLAYLEWSRARGGGPAPGAEVEVPAFRVAGVGERVATREGEVVLSGQIVARDEDVSPAGEVRVGGQRVALDDAGGFTLPAIEVREGGETFTLEYLDEGEVVLAQPVELIRDRTAPVVRVHQPRPGEGIPALATVVVFSVEDESPWVDVWIRDTRYRVPSGTRHRVPFPLEEGINPIRLVDIEDAAGNEAEDVVVQVERKELPPAPKPGPSEDDVAKILLLILTLFLLIGVREARKFFEGKK